MDAVRFNGGDDLIVPVTIMAGGEPVDLATGSLVVEVCHRHRALFEAEFVRMNNRPGEGEHHGEVRLSEEQTITLPHGRTAYLKATFNRTADDVTVSTEPMYLERVL